MEIQLKSPHKLKEFDDFALENNFDFNALSEYGNFVI